MKNLKIAWTLIILGFGLIAYFQWQIRSSLHSLRPMKPAFNAVQEKTNDSVPEEVPVLNGVESSKSNAVSTNSVFVLDSEDFKLVL